MTTTSVCADCGGVFDINHLDAKPQRLRGPHHTLDELIEAFDSNEDFDRLECGNCYGPGYVSLENNS